MAREMGDDGFAEQCDSLAERGGKWLGENLFDGEYFYQQRDPEHPEAFGAGIGCHIDQVFGPGLGAPARPGRVLPEDKTRHRPEIALALQLHARRRPLPRSDITTGRWYAMPGEAGLIMCTFPKGGEREAGGGKAGARFCRLLQRVHERLRVPGGRAHDRRRSGRRKDWPSPGRFTTATIPRAATPTTKSNAATTTPARWPATAFTSASAVSSTTARRDTSVSRRRSRRKISGRRSSRPKAGELLIRLSVKSDRLHQFAFTRGRFAC